MRFFGDEEFVVEVPSPYDSKFNVYFQTMDSEFDGTCKGDCCSREVDDVDSNDSRVPATDR